MKGNQTSQYKIKTCGLDNTILNAIDHAVLSQSFSSKTDFMKSIMTKYLPLIDQLTTYIQGLPRIHPLPTQPSMRNNGSFVSTTSYNLQIDQIEQIKQLSGKDQLFISDSELMRAIILLSLYDMMQKDPLTIPIVKPTQPHPIKESIPEPIPEPNPNIIQIDGKIYHIKPQGVKSNV